MQNFIVLGIVPGTNLQLTFGFWLLLVGALCALPIALRLWRKRHVLVAYVRSGKIQQWLSRAQADWLIDQLRLSA